MQDWQALPIYILIAFGFPDGKSVGTSVHFVLFYKIWFQATVSKTLLLMHSIVRRKLYVQYTVYAL